MLNVLQPQELMIVAFSDFTMNFMIDKILQMKN